MNLLMSRKSRLIIARSLAANNSNGLSLKQVNDQSFIGPLQDRLYNKKKIRCPRLKVECSDSLT